MIHLKPYSALVSFGSITMNVTAIAVILAMLYTPFSYPFAFNGLYITLIFIVIILVESLNSYMLKHVSKEIMADYTVIFAAFGTMLMGPIAGVFIIVLENLYFIIKSIRKLSRKPRTLIEYWLMYSYNLIASMLGVMAAHFVMYFTHGDLLMMTITFPLVIVTFDIIQLKAYGELKFLLSRYRNAKIPRPLLLQRFLPNVTNYILYYLFISFGPLLLFFALKSSLLGLFLALSILIPSQVTGMLYMQLKLKQNELCTDDLTGISNATKFRADMSRQLEMPDPYVLFLLDLDEFKSINDKHGHVTGNDVLIELSRCLRDLEQQYKLHCRVYRLHGDEFAISVFETSKIDEIVYKLNAINENLFVKTKDHAIKVTFSGGGALVMPGTTTRQALQMADHVLYAVKSDGRGKTILDTLNSQPDPVEKDFAVLS